MWRAVVSQPFDRACKLPARGALDTDAGEFWVENVFSMPQLGHNLSAYEQNRLFLNDGGRRFIDVSHASNANIDSDSRSVMIADFDRDHRPDLLVGSVGGGPLRLFLNQFPNSGHRIRVTLIGRESNRTGIGSRVTVECAGRRIVRDLFSPNGFMGQSPAELLIGVGDTTMIHRLTVRWPTGQSQQFENVPVDSVITIREGEKTFDANPMTPPTKSG